MNVESRINRIFGACILLMMAVLAVCTVTFTAAAEESSNSYSLVIAKIFDFDSPDYDGEELPEEVKTQAKEQTYTFRITGTRRDGEKTVPVDITFTLPRKAEDGSNLWESEVYSSNGPFDVMVTELTDNINIRDRNGNHYNMAGSSADTRVLVSSRRHEVQLRNNSILTIQRPENTGNEELWYQVTNRPYDGHETSGSYRPVNEVFSLKAGEEEKKLTGLCAAVYTIEQIAAPDGYQLQMGERVESVPGGNEGRFHINGTPGRLTLTAGGTRGDGATHYYQVERTETEEGDTSEFVKRTVSIASGESCVLDNLAKGGYTVTEYTIDASEASRITVPETEWRNRTGKSSALTTGTANSWKYIDLNDPDFDVDYIRMVSFGPLRSQSGNKLNNKTSYAVFRYAVLSADGTKYTNIKSHTTGYTGDKTTFVSNAPRMDVKPHKRIYFTATGLVSNTARTLDVSWNEYDEKETEKTFNRAGVPESVTVDERKWMRIEAPALNDPDADGADQIAYYYTIKDKDGNLIPGTTDRDGTSVKLLPGTGTELTLPAAGSYTVVETVEGNTPAGFTMKIEGHPFGTTEAGKEIEVRVGGRRDVTISKPPADSLPAGSADLRTYIFSISGLGFNREVRMKAGESGVVTLPNAGTYKIRPQNDSPGVYDLYYTDSGAVYGTASGSTGTVTFTNSFSQGAYGYRYVHEYYVRDVDADGDYTYTYEGNSPITTRLGRKEGESYEALDLEKAFKYNENNYEHFGEAYGWVDPIVPETSVRTIPDEELQADFMSEQNVESDSGESEGSDEDTEDISDSGEPEMPDEDIADTSDDGEAEDTGNISDSGEPEMPDEDITDTSDDGEAEAPAEDTGDISDGGEPEIPDEDITDTSDDGETEAPAEDTGNISDGGETEVPEEDVMVLSDSGEPESLSEDTPDETVAEEPDTPAGETTDETAAEEPDTPAGETTDETAAEEPDTPAEETTDETVAEESDTPAEDASDETVAEEPDTPAEDTSDETVAEEPVTSAEETLDEDGSEETEFYDERVSDSEGLKLLGTRSETIYGSGGIVDKGTGFDSDEARLNYAPDSEKDHIDVTTDARQIIILRYYRERQPEGKYNVIHVYYFRDENGDHWEGTSGVQPQNGELGVKYTGHRVEKVYSFQPSDAERPYTYTWDGRPQYGVVESSSHADGGNEFAGNGQVYRPNNAWTAAEGTEEGNQIIILRYYREAAREGNYNIVHEYYVREPGESQDSETEDPGPERAVRFLNADLADDSEIEDAEGDISGTFNGTLNRNRNDGFVYTFDGNTEPESITDLLGITHIAEEDDWKPTYGGNTYTYMDAGYGMKSDDGSYSCNPDQQWAASTEQGDEVIILRYVREETQDPETPPEDPETPPGDPETPPGDPETPPGDPETPPEDPGIRTEDTNRFSGDSGRTSEVPDSSGEIASLQDGNPGTGDNSRIVFWIVLASGSLCGIAMLKAFFRKRADR